MPHNLLPLVPTDILKAHKVNEPTDTRFKAAARLLRSLWRQEKGLPIGMHRNPNGKRRKLGSRIDPQSGRQGSNFLSLDIAKLALREMVYRENGAMIDADRLWNNLLSSQPLCFNVFGNLKLDLAKASSFFRELLPDFVASVEDIYFEHSPGRGDATYTEDHTAFDVFVCCTTTDGFSGFVAIEVKYSETMAETPATVRPRHDELSAKVALYRTPDAPGLRNAPLQQLWREHLLSRSMIETGLYPKGRFVVIYPKQNNQCASAVHAYQNQLVSEDPEESGFQAVTLDQCVEVFHAIGEHETADAIHERYLDFGKVERAIFG